MTDEIEEQNETTKEKLQAVGQIILGELEAIGGILTADPISHAEGEFNVEAGTVHLESRDALDEDEEAEAEESNLKK